MRGAELARAVTRALAIATAAPGVVEAEAFVSANRSLLARLNYTSNIPCNGVEEPKSTERVGLGLQVVFEGPDGPLVGFGAEPSDLGEAGVRRALDKARRGAVRDAEFHSLPRPASGARSLTDYHDPQLMGVTDEALVAAGWDVISGGLSAFTASARLAELGASDAGLRALGLILNGDVAIEQLAVAIASTRMPAPQVDESAFMTSAVTAMVESHGAKGSGWSTAIRLDDFTDEAGGEAAQAAVAAVGGQRVPTGDYTVVFGRQPVADLLSNLVLPGCQAGSFYASSTPFLGKLGRTVAVPELSLYDHGALPGLVGSRGITCEGLPTGRTDLIKDGVLAGALAHWYDAQRLLADPRLGEKLGADGEAAARALAPRSGFRPGRAFDRRPTTAASNVIVESRQPLSREELLRQVGDGLYIGRIWYTYPINGLRAGDFTCTAIADSFVIRDGRLAAPIRANAVRINDNITRLLQSIVGITKDVRGTPVWGADEVVYAPEIAASAVHVDAIADAAGASS